MSEITAFTDEGWALAKKFHEVYERLAPSFGYETRAESAKPWGEVPLRNKQLMAATCTEILADQSAELARVRGLLQRQSDAVRELYYSAKWSADRPVDEAALWIAVRDACEFTPGNAPTSQRKCADCAQAEDHGCHRNFTADGGYYHPFVAMSKNPVCPSCHDGVSFKVTMHLGLAPPSKPLSVSCGICGHFIGEFAHIPANFRPSSSLVPQGAESADIGKLDTADKSGLREPAKLNNAHKSGAESPLSSPPHNSDCICIPCMSKATGELLKRDVNLDPGRCCNNGYFGQQHKCQKSNPAASPELLPTQLDQKAE